MIKINLLAEKKPAKTRARKTRVRDEGAGRGRNIVLVGILLIGVVVAGSWWYVLSRDQAALRERIAKADAELQHLAEVRKKGEEYERQKELLARKIELITELKRRQAVPVHILDHVSKSLPEFVWLESMTANTNQLSISGKATSFNAVSNFYGNLTQSGHFGDVTLGRTFEVPEGVAFSLTCRFIGTDEPDADRPQG